MIGSTRGSPKQLRSGALMANPIALPRTHRMTLSLSLATVTCLQATRASTQQELKLSYELAQFDTSISTHAAQCNWSRKVGLLRARDGSEFEIFGSQQLLHVFRVHCN
jgi:hypothetical protein